MKTVIANLLRAYEVNTTLKYDELTFELMLTMKIVQRWMISLKARDFWEAFLGCIEIPEFYKNMDFGFWIELSENLK